MFYAQIVFSSREITEYFLFLLNRQASVGKRRVAFRLLECGEATHHTCCRFAATAELSDNVSSVQQFATICSLAARYPASREFPKSPKLLTCLIF